MKTREFIGGIFIVIGMLLGAISGGDGDLILTLIFGGLSICSFIIAAIISKIGGDNDRSRKNFRE